MGKAQLENVIVSTVQERVDAFRATTAKDLDGATWCRFLLLAERVRGGVDIRKVGEAWPGGLPVEIELLLVLYVQEVGAGPFPAMASQ